MAVTGVKGKFIYRLNSARKYSNLASKSLPRRNCIVLLNILAFMCMLIQVLQILYLSDTSRSFSRPDKATLGSSVLAHCNSTLQVQDSPPDI